MKLTPQAAETLSKINSLILENDNDNSVKKALYAASETYLNNIKMEQQQQKPIDALLALIEGIVAAELPTLIQKGEIAISGLFHKHKDKIVAIANDIHNCPPGTEWSDIAGACVKSIG